MEHGLSRVSLLVVLAAGALLGTLASSACAATVSAYSYRGPTAVALFESSEGCVEYRGFVSAWNRIERDEHGGWTPTPDVLIDTSQSNWCNGTSNLRFGRAEFDPGDLRVRGDLGVASLRGTVEMHPYGPGPTTPITLDLTWRATTDMSRRRFIYHARYGDGTVLITHELGGFRSAVASGTISDGRTDYTVGRESTLAAMFFSKVGNIEIYR